MKTENIKDYKKIKNFEKVLYKIYNSNGFYIIPIFKKFQKKIISKIQKFYWSLKLNKLKRDFKKGKITTPFKYSKGYTFNEINKIKSGVYKDKMEKMIGNIINNENGGDLDLLEFASCNSDEEIEEKINEIKKEK